MNRSNLLLMMALGAVAVAPVAAAPAKKPVKRSPAPAAVSAVPAVPFALRGVTLGITLPEFRKIAVPVTDGWTDARPVCSIDPVVRKPSVAGHDQEAGLINCVWYARLPRAYSVEQSMPVTLGDGRADVSFHFDLKLGGEPRLFRIMVSSELDNWSSIYPAYVLRYGQPNLMTSPVQNKLGASFEQTTAVWANSVSTIVIMSRCPRIDTMCITYSHKALSDEYDAKYRLFSTSAADRL